MPDIEPIKARVVIEYDGSGLEKAKEDLASLGEAAGGMGESVGGAGESLAALDEQLGKSAEGTRSFNEALTGLPKVFEGSETAVLGFTDAMQEHQSVIEDTATSFAAMEEPLKSFNESMQTVSETVASPHLAENMSVFQDALANPEPFQLVQGYLGETGQSWSDFASSIGSDNMSILKSNREFLSDLRSSGGSVFEMYGGESVKRVTTDLGAFAQQMDGVAESVTRTNEGINKFGGIEGVLSGPLEELQSYKPLGIGEAFSNASEGMMSFLYDAAMPMFMLQGVGYMLGQVGQTVYNFAAIAEGPAAHSMGTFTGTVDALGQSVQRTAAQFSEGIGNGVLPTLNALNYQASQTSGGLGDQGQGLGAALGFLGNLAQIGLGFNVTGGVEGLINQGAAFLGMQQPFQGPGPQSQGQIAYQQAFANMPRTVQDQGYQLQTQTAQYLQMASDPAFLADQEQFVAAQQIYQRAQQNYTSRHPVNQQQMLMDYQYQQFAQQEATNEAMQQANAPTYLGDIMRNLFQGNFGAAGQDFMQAMGFGGGGGPRTSALGALFGDNGTGPRTSVAGGWWNSLVGTLGQDFQDAWSWLFNPSSTPAPPPTSGCFVAGTKVLMSDGTEKAIETVQTGEQVLAHDGTKQVTTTILAFIQPPPKRVYKLTFSNGQTLTLTNSHPVMTTEGWKSLSPKDARQENPGLITTTLLLGDKVHTADGVTTLTSILPLQGTRQVYNITVGDTHTFYANGVLVHNKTAGAPIGPQISEQIGGIQLPHIDFSGISSQLAGAFGGIQLPHLDLSGLTSGLASSFAGISLPHLDLSGMISGLASSFAGISLPHLDLSGMISGLASEFAGISLPHLDLSGLTSGLASEFAGISLPHLDLSGFTAGLASAFSGITLPPLPNLGQQISAALGSMFSGISLPSIPGFAGGVENFSGGAAFIAEGGPELVTLPQGASVYPLSTGSAVGGNMTPISLGGGGGGGNMPQSLNLHLQIGDAVISQLGIPLAQNMRLVAGYRGY